MVCLYLLSYNVKRNLAENPKILVDQKEKLEDNYPNDFPEEETIRQIIKDENKNYPVEINSEHKSKKESNKEKHENNFENKDRKYQERIDENKSFIQIEKEVDIKEKAPIYKANSKLFFFFYFTKFLFSFISINLFLKK